MLYRSSPLTLRNLQLPSSRSHLSTASVQIGYYLCVLAASVPLVSFLCQQMAAALIAPPSVPHRTEPHDPNTLPVINPAHPCQQSVRRPKLFSLAPAVCYCCQCVLNASSFRSCDMIDRSIDRSQCFSPFSPYFPVFAFLCFSFLLLLFNALSVRCA